MAMAFYNVADPNNAFAVHSTTMIKQELGFWLSVFTPDSVDDDIDEFISSIVATTHYTRTDISQACDVALMLHAMPRLKDKIAALISHKLPFAQVMEGLEIAARPQSAKVMIEFEGADA